MSSSKKAKPSELGSPARVCFNPVPKDFGGSTEYYYAYGSTPPTNLECGDSDTNVLWLGSGDPRALLSTLFRSADQSGVLNALLNDCSAPIVARNAILLALASDFPPSTESLIKRRTYIADVWAIWFSHGLSNSAVTLLESTLQFLVNASKSLESWKGSRLVSWLIWPDVETLRRLRKCWKWWLLHFKTRTFSDMCDDRIHSFKNTLAESGDLNKSYKQYAQSMVSNLYANWPNNDQMNLITEKKVEVFVKEAYSMLRSAVTRAEPVLGNDFDMDENFSPNMTLYPAQRGYTLHFGSCPLFAFEHRSMQYTHRNVCASGMPTSVRDDLLVPDVAFDLSPFCANSVQQFGLWLAALRRRIDRHSIFIKLHCKDALILCRSLQDKMFDRIHASNLEDFVGLLNVVTHAAPILTPETGVLTTSSKRYTAFEATVDSYVRKALSLPLEILHGLTGIRCVNHEGRFAYTDPAPSAPPPDMMSDNLRDRKSSRRQSEVFWRWHPNITKLSKLSPSAVSALVQCARRCCEFDPSKDFESCAMLTPDSWACVIRLVAARLQPQNGRTVWDKLCKAIDKESTLTPYIACLGAQCALRAKVNMKFHALKNQGDVGEFIRIRMSIPKHIHEGMCDNLQTILLSHHRFPILHVHTSHMSQTFNVINDHEIEQGFLSFHASVRLLHYPDASLSVQYAYRIPGSKTCEYLFKVIERNPISLLSFALIKAARVFNRPLKFPPTPILSHVEEINSYSTALYVDSADTSGRFDKRFSKNSCEVTFSLNGSDLASIVYPLPVDLSTFQISGSRKQRLILVNATKKALSAGDDNVIPLVEGANRRVWPLASSCVSQDSIRELSMLQFSRSERGVIAAGGNDEFTFPLLNLRRIVHQWLDKPDYSHLQLNVLNSSQVHALLVKHDVVISVDTMAPALDVSYCPYSTDMQKNVMPWWNATTSVMSNTKQVMIGLEKAELNIIDSFMEHWMNSLRRPMPSASSLRHVGVDQFFTRTLIGPLYRISRRRFSCFTPEKTAKSSLCRARPIHWLPRFTSTSSTVLLRFVSRLR